MFQGANLRCFRGSVFGVSGANLRCFRGIYLFYPQVKLLFYLLKTDYLKIRNTITLYLTLITLKQCFVDNFNLTAENQGNGAIA